MLIRTVVLVAKNAEISRKIDVFFTKKMQKTIDFLLLQDVYLEQEWSKMEQK